MIVFIRTFFVDSMDVHS